jgi:transcriptional regulator with XRE-family HTH domain
MDENIATKVGHKIKQARTEAGLTLRELGQLISVSHIAISEWERGIVRIYLESLVRIARALHKPLAYFLADLEQELLGARSLDTATLQIERDITDPMDNEIRAMLLLQSAVKARYAGQPEQAAIYASKSKAIWESLGEQGNVASTLVALGDITGRAQGDWDTAEAHYRQAVSIMESLQPKDAAGMRRHAQALWALSRVPAQRGQYPEALDLLAQARQLASNDSFGLAVCGRLAGSIHLALGEIQRATQVLNEALIHAQKAGHPHGEAEILLLLAKTRLASNNKNDAVQYLSQAESLAHKEEFSDVLDQIASIRGDHNLQ